MLLSWIAEAKCAAKELFRKKESSAKEGYSTEDEKREVEKRPVLEPPRGAALRVMDVQHTHSERPYVRGGLGGDFGAVHRNNFEPYPVDHSRDEYIVAMCESLRRLKWTASTVGDGTYIIYAMFDRRRGSFCHIFAAETDPARGPADASDQAGCGMVLNSLFVLTKDWTSEDLTGTVTIPKAVLAVLRTEKDESSTPELFEGFYQLDSYDAVRNYIGVWRVRRCPGAKRRSVMPHPHRPRFPYLSPTPLTGPPAYDNVETGTAHAVIPISGPRQLVPRLSFQYDARPKKIPVLSRSELPFDLNFITVYQLDRGFLCLLPTRVLIDRGSVLWTTICAPSELLQWYGSSSFRHRCR